MDQMDADFPIGVIRFTEIDRSLDGRDMSAGRDARRYTFAA
jgi:hypothetical protein